MRKMFRVTWTENKFARGKIGAQNLLIGESKIVDKRNIYWSTYQNKLQASISTWASLDFYLRTQSDEAFGLATNSSDIHNNL